MRRVLLFDSGVGGLSIFDALVAARVPVQIDYAADDDWLPYGDKPDAALRARVSALTAALAAQSRADLVVLACNTASTIALDAARAATSVPIVGVVPPIKPAAELTRSGIIGLLATPATVARAYTDELVARFAAGQQVVRVGSTALVAAAEAKLAGRPFDEQAVAEAVDKLFAAHPAMDVVALACTHFPLLRAELEAAGPRGVRWLDSGAAIARRVRALLKLQAEGAAISGVAWFTKAASGYAASPAFHARGFTGIHRFDAQPGTAGVMET